MILLYGAVIDYTADLVILNYLSGRRETNPITQFLYNSKLLNPCLKLTKNSIMHKIRYNST
jgi:hypothetical protein